MTLPNLALLHDGDSYLLHLTEDGKVIHLTLIQRFENNENCEPTEMPYFHLDERARAAVLRQIQRRYAGRTVKV